MQKISTLSSGGFLSLCACEYVIPLPLCPGDIDCPPAQPTGRSLIRLQPPYQLAKHAQLRSQHQPTSSSYPPSNISLMVFFLRDCLPCFRSKVLVGTWACLREKTKQKLPAAWPRSQQDKAPRAARGSTRPRSPSQYHYLLRPARLSLLLGCTPWLLLTSR